jgi:hypothetical protein
VLLAEGDVENYALMFRIMAETKENSSTTVPIKEGMQMLTPATAVVRRLTPMD